MVYLIAYDLKAPHDTQENYDLIISAIKSQFKAWCHIEQSVWLVDADITSVNLRDNLKNYLHAGDVLFVARLQRGWASWNFGELRNDWLKDRNF